MYKKKLPSNISFFTIGRISAISAQAAFYLIFAALMEPTSYGELSYFISIAGTLSVISRFGLNHSAMVFGAKGKLTLMNQANVLSIITISFASLILIFVNEYAALLCFGMSTLLMYQSSLIGLKEYKKFMGNAIIKSVLFICLPIVLYFVLDIPGILLGIAISNLIPSYGFFKLIKKKIHKFQELRSNTKVLINNFGVDTSSNLIRFVDKLLIVPLLGFTMAGLYQFNLQILFLLEMLPISMHAFFLSEESSKKSHRKLYTLLMIGSISLVISVIVCSPFLIDSLFPNYSDGILGLQVLIITLIPISISSIFQAKLQARESTKVGLGTPIRIGVFLGLIAWLGTDYGLVGLSAAVLFSSIVYTIILAVIFKTGKKIQV
tara:strand:+ start:243 stop:1376 length:1134 start_codon:yes stop_codon:yes gene_type:complete